MILAVIAAALAACDDGGVDPEPAVLAPLYTLQSVDGDPLPYRVFLQGGIEVQTTSASLAFSGNSVTFTQIRRERDVGSSVWRTRDPKQFVITFTRDGNDLEIQTVSVPVPSAGLAFSVSGDGSTITLNFPMEDDNCCPAVPMIFKRA